MKRFLAGALLALGAIGVGQSPTWPGWPFRLVLYAQTLPVTVQYQWAPNPASENVTSYLVTLDGGTAVSVPVTACTATVCSTPVVVNAFGSHTSTVAAVNQEISTDPTSGQTSLAASVTWSLVQTPSRPSNVTLKK